jgi:hypothetical protein
MLVVLRRMTEETFRTYMREHEEEYVGERTISDQESFEEAMRNRRAR